MIAGRDLVSSVATGKLPTILQIIPTHTHASNLN